jgi:hypothetical protein
VVEFVIVVFKEELVDAEEVGGFLWVGGWGGWGRIEVVGEVGEENHAVVGKD